MRSQILAVQKMQQCRRAVPSICSMSFICGHLLYSTSVLLPFSPTWMQKKQTKKFWPRPSRHIWIIIKPKAFFKYTIERYRSYVSGTAFICIAHIPAVMTSLYLSVFVPPQQQGSQFLHASHTGSPRTFTTSLVLISVISFVTNSIRSSLIFAL